MRVYTDVAADLADPTKFTGRVWRTDIVVAPDHDHLSGLRFSYEPGARSFWHIHEREQVIVGIDGHGLAFWEGGDGAVALNSGDWWHVTPGIAHWHGALAHTTFSHLAVNSGGGTQWLHEVSEADYQSAVDSLR